MNNDFWNDAPSPLPPEAEQFLTIIALILGTIFLAVTLLALLIRWLIRQLMRRK